MKLLSGNLLGIHEMMMIKGIHEMMMIKREAIGKL